MRLYASLLLSGTLALAATSRPMRPDEKVLHALNRLSFGPRQGDVETVQRMGLQKWIEAQLHPENIPENPLLEQKLASLESLTLTTPQLLEKYPSQQMLKAMATGRMELPQDPQTRAAAEAILARLKAKQEGGDEPKAAAKQVPGVVPMQMVARDLMQAKLLRAIYSRRQLEEVLTDFWFNHFNVYLDKGADRFLVTVYERDVIRPHVLGRFKDLLLATAQSPAMLFYLDNWQSSSPDTRLLRAVGAKRTPGLNENYGRELMELHTLGVDGGYTQQDVTEVARCFTGWTIRAPRMGGDFFFNPRMHDNGEKTVLGVKIPPGGGMADGLKVIDLLAHHPSTAHFIARKLAERFVADDPPEQLVVKMAATFQSKDGDIREVMRTMLAAPEFWDAGMFRSKVKSPFEMVVSAVRAVDGDVVRAMGLAQLMNQLGQPLYRKQEPTGYSSRGADWMNSASLLARINFANALAQDRAPGIHVDTSQFIQDAAEIQRRLLFTNPGKDEGTTLVAKEERGPAIAGLTLGSPEFQRH